MLNVALAHLYGVYGDPVHVGWLTTAFMLTAAASAAVCARLGDLYGRKRVMLIMLAIAFVGSGVSALAPNLNLIIAGRALQGTSMAVLPLAFGLLREQAEDGGEVNLGVGLLAGVYAFGVGLGAVLGGLVVDNGHWQQIFLVSAAAAALALVLVWRAARALPGRRPDGPLDLLGGASVVLPIVAILLGLSNARTTAWTEAAVWGLIAAGMAGLGVWVRHELRQPNPLINLRQFQTPQIAIVNTLAFVTALGALNYAPVILPMLQQPLWTGVGLGVTATVAGLLKLLTNLTCTAAAFGAGYASRRRGMRQMVLVGAAANVIGWGALVLMHDSLFAVITICVLFIAPAGTLLVAGCSAIIIEATPEDRTSEATGLTQVLRSIALGMGAVVTGLVLSSSSISNGGQTYPDEQAYMTVFVVMAFGSVAALVTALIIPRRTSCLPTLAGSTPNTDRSAGMSHGRSPTAGESESRP